MKTAKKSLGSIIALACVISMLLAFAGIPVNAQTQASISYSFAEQKAGYAQGTISFTADAKGTYELYWTDSQGKILDGYYPIDTLNMSAGETQTIKMGYHTAIPANAAKIVAVTSKSAQPTAVYVFPQSKRLSAASGTKLYSFSAYSDIHIDRGSGWYCDADTHLKEGLQYAANKGSDYIIVSGDVVTNDSGPDKEWKAYQKILSESSYVNPVWESDGNHDMRQDVESGISSFIKHSGTDSVKSSNKKPYFYMVEEKTGDVFIFMALELNKNPNDAAEFTDTQLTWAENLIKQYTAKKVNVFLVQHSPIKKYGAGDRMSDPLYKGLLNTKYEANAKFKELIQKYPNVVWVSGHTHEDLDMEYNYSDENNEACHMIHIPSLAGSTKANAAKNDLERNKGHGFNSQGYYTEVYQNEIVFYGVNLSDKLIYPKYSYIMESSRTASSPVCENTADPALTGVETDITAELAKVSSILSKYYQYSSYDQYQALKKLYYQYRNSTKADQVVITMFEDRITALSQHTGAISVQPLRDTYYFENNKSWSKVYGYAWNGLVHNAEWPGVKLSKVGESNGNDVYVVKFSSAGQYPNLIFTDGSSQTIDIDLADHSGNCFKLGSTKDGKYTVSSYSFSPSGTVTDPEQPEPTVQSDYALLYYISGEHDWSDTSKLFTLKNGTYTYKLTSKGTSNISFSLYDKINKKYLSMETSASLTYATGQTSSYTLVTRSSRGNSITVKGMTAGAVLSITYDPATKGVSVFCGDLPDPLENTSTISAGTIKAGSSVTVQCSSKGGTGGTTYAVYSKLSTATYYSTVSDFSSAAAAVFTPSKGGTYYIRTKAKDSSGTVSVKDIILTVTDTALRNNSVISSSESTAGGTVTVTAAASGGTAPYSYAVYYKTSSATYYSTVKDYGTAQTINVSTPSAGVCNIRVRVKDSAGATVDAGFDVTVSGAALSNKSVISSSAVTAGESVTVNSAAAGGTSPYQYALYYKKSSAKYYSTARDYSSSAKISLRLSEAGTYDLRARVKDSAGTTADKNFTVTVSKAELANNSTLSAASFALGGKTTIKAAAAGGTGYYTYAAYYKLSTSKYFTTISGFGSGSSISFTPSESGKYTIRTKVKDSDGTIAVKDLTLTVAKTLGNASTVSASSVSLGSGITVTCKSTGVYSNCTYAVYYKKSSYTYYTTVQDFGANKTTVITPQAKGTYNIRTKVRDAAGTTVTKDFTVKVV